MRYLIDTQALIWFVENNPKLSISAREVIETTDNEIFVCQFSFVGIPIKEALHKVVVKNGLKALTKILSEIFCFTYSIIPFFFHS